LNSLSYLKKSRKSISKGYGYIGDIANDNFSNDNEEETTVSDFAYEIIKPISSISDILNKQILFKKTLNDKLLIAANENSLERQNNKKSIIEQAKENEIEEEKDFESSSLLATLTTLGIFTAGLLAHFSGFLDWFITDKPNSNKGIAFTDIKNTPSYSTNNPRSNVQEYSTYKNNTNISPKVFNNPIQTYKPLIASPVQKYRSPFSSNISPKLFNKKPSFNKSGISSDYSKLFSKPNNKLKVGKGLPSGDIVALGRSLQTEGFRISEHDSFGGTTRVHGKNSAHYDQNAIDINIGNGNVEANDPEMRRKMDDIAARMRASGYSVLWKVKGHYNHIHAQVGGKGIKGAIKRGISNIKNIFSSNTPSPSTNSSKDEGIDYSSITKSLKSLMNNDTSYNGSIEEITRKNSKKITQSNMMLKNKIIEARTPKPIITEKAQPTNISSDKAGTIQTLSKNNDKNVLMQYINYFGLAI
jgi:hypothetical protein